MPVPVYTDIINSLETANQSRAQTEKEIQNQQLLRSNSQSIVEAVNNAIQLLIDFQKSHQPKVAVTNQKVPKIPDFQGLIDSLQSVEKTVLQGIPDNKRLVKSLQQLNDNVKQLSTSFQFPEIPEPLESVTVKNQLDYSSNFKLLTQAIENIDVKPEVIVKQNKVILDIQSIVKVLSDVITAVRSIKIPEVPSTDITPLIDATNQVQRAISSLSFPVPNYVLPFRNQQGKATQLQLDANGGIPLGSTSAYTSNAASNVAASATNVTLLVANSSRRGCSIYNDSSATLYLKLGVTASTSSFTVKLFTDDYYDVSPSYTGQIDGIWSSATGSARIVEFT